MNLLRAIIKNTGFIVSMLLKHFKQHYFSYTIIFLVLLTIGSSYYRFMITYDYLVYDEVECDPYTESCFVYCEDEECSEPFYYVEMERLASNLMQYCDGNNIDCEAAYWCLEEEKSCNITYCDPTTDGDLCEYITEGDMDINNDETEALLIDSDYSDPDITEREEGRTDLATSSQENLN